MFVVVKIKFHSIFYKMNFLSMAMNLSSWIQSTLNLFLLFSFSVFLWLNNSSFRLSNFCIVFSKSSLEKRTHKSMYLKSMQRQKNDFTSLNGVLLAKCNFFFFFHSLPFTVSYKLRWLSYRFMFIFSHSNHQHVKYFFFFCRE